MLDIGSYGNLAGDLWIRQQAKTALSFNRLPKEVQRDRPLNVSGVGNGSQKCTHDVHLPLAFLTTKRVSKAIFRTPCVPNSELPALLGLQSIKNARGIIDTNTNMLYMVGQGDYDLARMLPPGTEAPKADAQTFFGAVGQCLQAHFAAR